MIHRLISQLIQLNLAESLEWAKRVELTKSHVRRIIMYGRYDLEFLNSFINERLTCDWYYLNLFDELLIRELMNVPYYLARPTKNLFS